MIQEVFEIEETYRPELPNMHGHHLELVNALSLSGMTAGECDDWMEDRWDFKNPELPTVKQVEDACGELAQMREEWLALGGWNDEPNII